MANNSPMSDSHKAALAVGRQEGKAVRAYLEAFEANKPKRGRKRTSDTVSKRLDAIDAEMAAAGGIDRLLLVQERLDLQAELKAMGQTVDMGALEAAFVDAAKGYGERKGISLAAWREIGIPAELLQRAGISRRG